MDGYFAVFATIVIFAHKYKIDAFYVSFSTHTGEIMTFFSCIILFL